MTGQVDDAIEALARTRGDLREAVKKAVPNAAYRDLALRMACSTRGAGDYILQAPVLALAATFGLPYSTPGLRNAIVGTFAARCQRGPKLRDLMAEYHVAYGFRALRGIAIQPSKEACIFAISRLQDLHPSTLAQCIPSSPGAQQKWLRIIKDWMDQLLRRGVPNSAGLAWVVPAARQALDLGCSSFTDLADFYIARRASFNPRWSYEEARSAMVRWHEAAFVLDPQAGAVVGPQVDYAPLPLKAEVDGFTFQALTTKAALNEEGAAMRHCVGSYYRDVVEGRSRIYSVSLIGRRRATLELQPAYGSDEQLRFVTFSQLKTHSNGTPGTDVANAVQKFVWSIHEELKLRRSHNAEPAA